MKNQNKNSKKQFGDYFLGKTLGEGTFGKVKLATHKFTGQKVAIKILQKDKIKDVSDVERVTRQIHILKLIRHPNIVQLYQIFQTQKQLLLIMEYMQQGQLFHCIEKNRRLSQQQASKLFSELIDGVQYLHTINVVHRDLKPQNLLLDYKKSLKIVDFGLSNTYKNRQLLKTPCGSPCYAAPQMIKGQKYQGLKVDIWSCGVVLFTMVCGYLPFQDPDTSALYSKILSGKYSFHRTVSQQAKDLISKILVNDHNKRYTIEDIRNHPWMQKKKKQQSVGIRIGFNKIPIDSKIVQSLKNYNFEPDYVRKCLQANRHNNVTTAYYLQMKKYVKAGGNTECDIASKNFDRSLLQPNKRKDINHSLVLVDNFFSKTSEDERKRSKQKHSKQKINITAQLKKLKMLSKTKKQVKNDKINNSLNYGYYRIPLTSKSVEKNSSTKRDSMLENRISRKYQQKFNNSLISKSKQKCQQRSRINSAANYQRKKENIEINNIMDDYPIKGKKVCPIKKTFTNSTKCDTTKIIKSKRY